MRTIVVGDVHGCAEELQLLLDLVRPSREDTVVFLGDLVDKGPSVHGVLEIVRGLQAVVPSTVVVRGNHEHRLVKNGREENMGLTDEQWELLAGTRFYRKLPEHGALAVHAGVPPGVRSLPDTHEDVRSMNSAERRDIVSMMYVRDITVDGRSMAWPWAYDGRFGHAYFGHRVTMGEPSRYPHATGIDLGCVYGGHLCGVTLVVGEVPVFTTVRALSQYLPVEGQYGLVP